MSVSEHLDARYGTIVVVGGGCYGSYYVTQLERARAAGALIFDRVLVVDRDPDCSAAKLAQTDDVAIHVADWSVFFDAYLAEASDALVHGLPASNTPRAQRHPDATAQNANVVHRTPQGGRDAIVPSPLMPHLMYEWLVRRARERWPHRMVETRPLPGPPDTPWERAAPDGTHYASFATWMCPINCIEPRRCPHTRGERTWSMPVAADAYVAAAEGRGDKIGGPVIFHCTHRAYGVGMFDTRDVVAGDAFIAAAGRHGPADVLVGTVSHCHGAFNLLHLGA